MNIYAAIIGAFAEAPIFAIAGWGWATRFDHETMNAAIAGIAWLLAAIVIGVGEPWINSDRRERS